VGIIRIFSLFLVGCASFDVGNIPTRIEPLPVKTAIKDSAVILSVPLKVEKKKTTGYRSLVDAQFDIRLTEPDGIDVPLIPNGLIVGIRTRW
jgi:hypothetical protein